MTAFGTVLKEFRRHKRWSQMDLGLEANVSARHISFLENGRSKPSREMVLHLSKVMAVASKDANVLLSSAGFAHQFTQSDLYGVEMKDVRKALSFMLDAHEPYPAVVIDGGWNLLMTNRAQLSLMQTFSRSGANFPDTANLMELFFHPEGLQPFVKNWDVVSVFLLRRIYQEHLIGERREMPNQLLQTLLAMPTTPDDWKDRELVLGTAPMVEVELIVNGVEISLFSTISTFGTALDVTLQDLRIEQYFPGNDVTHAFLQALAKDK